MMEIPETGLKLSGYELVDEVFCILSE